MPDDAANLEAEEHAGRAQVEHDHREVLVGDVVELQVDARQQERVAIPARRAVDLQRDLARRLRVERLGGRGADRDHFAAGVDDEVGRVRAR